MLLHPALRRAQLVILLTRRQRRPALLHIGPRFRLGLRPALLRRNREPAKRLAPILLHSAAIARQHAQLHRRLPRPRLRRALQHRNRFARSLLFNVRMIHQQHRQRVHRGNITRTRRPSQKFRRLREVVLVPAGDRVQSPHRKLAFGVLILRRPAEPLLRSAPIQRNAVPAQIHHAQISLRAPVPLRGKLGQQLPAHLVIPGHSHALQIQDRQVQLGLLRTAPRRAREPLEGLRLIPLHANAPDVEVPQLVLCSRIALVGRLLEPVRGLHQILGHALADHISAGHPQLLLDRRAPLRGRRIVCIRTID